jgi:hypothetical protein
MAFPIIPIITAIPSLITAFNAVKKTEKEHTPKQTITTKEDHNASKKAFAIQILVSVGLLKKIKKRGGDINDLGVIVDFACFLYKVIRGKKRK